MNCNDVHHSTVKDGTNILLCIQSICTLFFKPFQINNGIFDTCTNDTGRTIDTIDIPTLKGQAQGPCRHMCLYNRDTHDSSVRALDLRSSVHAHRS
jgi:hypothetical protein